MRPGRRRPRAPTPASPPWRTRREWISGAGDPQQSSRTQGARGSPAPLCPLESGGLGAKRACVAFLSQGALGLLLAARGDFPFAQCSCQKLVLGRRCDGASALNGRAGSGGMAAGWAQKASGAHPCFPAMENPSGVDFGRRRPPAKQQGPGSQGQPRPALPSGEQRAGAKTAYIAFLS